MKASGNSLAVFQKLFHINLNNYLDKTVSVRSAQPTPQAKLHAYFFHTNLSGECLYPFSFPKHFEGMWL